MAAFQSRETSINALNDIASRATALSRKLHERALFQGDLAAGVGAIQASLDVLKRGA